MDDEIGITWYQVSVGVEFIVDYVQALCLWYGGVQAADIYGYKSGIIWDLEIL